VSSDTSTKDANRLLKITTFEDFLIMLVYIYHNSNGVKYAAYIIFELILALLLMKVCHANYEPHFYIRAAMQHYEKKS
jgi:uncharacterized membrane protein